MNGTCRKSNTDRRFIDVGQNPVGSEEVILSSKAALTIKKAQEDEVLLKLTWLESGYEFSYGELVAGIEQALLALRPDGCWLTRRGPLSGE